MSKKKAGSYNTPQMKASSLIPQVFNTDVNKNWLDSTLDRMISKGTLKNVEGFIGDVSGKNRSVNDVYLPSTDMLSTITVRDKNKNLIDAITVDDIANAINVNVSAYNYNAAYATKQYGYYPPIDTHKFINYASYAWVDQMPTYESIRTLSDPTNILHSRNGNYAGFSDVINPIDLSADQLTYILTDNNNTFNLRDQMHIKFTGSGWHADAQNYTYAVSGTGTSIKLTPIYNWTTHTTILPRTTKTTVTVGGLWDEKIATLIDPNVSSSFWTTHNLTTPTDMLAHYNADATRLPLFDGFTFTSAESNKTQFVVGDLIAFSQEWNLNEVEHHKLYYTTRTEAGDIAFVLLIDATETATGFTQSMAAGTTEAAIATYKDKLKGWDTSHYDKSVVIFTEKDYVVSSTSSVFNTAWSRNNKWTNVDTLKLINDLVYGGINIEELTAQKNIASRPIVEFEGNMNLWDWASYSPTLAKQWLGIVDFAVEVGSSLAVLSEVQVGQTVIFINEDGTSTDTNVYTIASKSFDASTSTWTITKSVTAVLETNHTAYIRSALPDTMDKAWSNSDAWWTGAKWSTGQQRININQMPLFRLYDTSGTPLEDLPGSAFAGSRVFNYKVGSGLTDKELGFALAYKDVNGIAEYQFENYILTETQYQSVTSQFSKKVNQYRKIDGTYLFKNNNLLSSVYKQSEKANAAETLITVDVTDLTTDLTINVGSSTWLPTDHELILHQALKNENQTCVITELKNGTYLDKTNVDHNFVYVNKGSTTIHNNLLNSAVTIKTVSGVDVPRTTPTADQADNTIVIDLSSYNEKIVIAPVDATINGTYTLIPTNKQDSLYHTVNVNGVFLGTDKYTINAANIVVAKEHIALGDVVDVRYYDNNVSNNTLNITSPDTIKSNPTNKLLTTFTMSETFSHWKNMLENTPGFTGNVYGTNNYSQLFKGNYLGGEIFVHKDISIISDALYASSVVSVTDALNSAGVEWDNFRNRFRNQVVRMYGKKNYASVKSLVDDVLKSITINRKGGKLFSTSNMAYYTKAVVQEFEIAAGVAPTLTLDDNIHSDDNIQDHVYVYVTDNVGGVLLTHMLQKDVDYTQAGSTLKFDYIPVAMPAGPLPVIAVYHYAMDDASYIPPSITKLKMAPGWVPHAAPTNVLIGHDGYQWDINPGSDLTNMNSAQFDPINAAQLELELRIYAGLVVTDSINTERENNQTVQYASAISYMPSQTYATWYTLATVNDMLYKSYTSWKSISNLTETTVAYDASNIDTINFSSTILKGHLSGQQLPGHWIGAYNILFGTSTPHLTPWHMLGFGFKPTWWDATYSWTDATKRIALINALQTGQSSTTQQNIKHANYHWDWVSKCPVKTDGQLENVATVLSADSISELDKSKPFVFGDWAGLEYSWRTSAAGQAALINVVVKLNPPRAFSDFYYPGTTSQQTNIDYLDRDNKDFHTPASYAVPGTVYNEVVAGITITTSATDKFSKSTYIKLIGDDNAVEALATLSLDETIPTIGSDGVSRYFVTGASISRRGRSHTTEPAVYTNMTASQINNSTITITMKQVEHVACGITQALYNYTLRNNIDYSIDNLHNRIDTQLGTLLNGFSSKHLIDMKTDTYDNTAHTLGENDFDIEMYKSSPIAISIASSIVVTRVATGWEVSGQGYGKQEFLFLEPDNTNTTSYSNVTISGIDVKKYKKFAPVASIVEYNTVLGKIQDTYTFIRGYYAHLESIGFKFPYSGDSVAIAFVKWAITAPAYTSNPSKIFNIGKTLTFSPAHGVVEELNKGVFKENTVARLDGSIIDSESLNVSRLDNVLTLTTKENETIGSVGFVVVQYEHIALLNNKTKFGVVVKDSVSNTGQDKIKFRGLITDAWTGSKSAPGYLVFDNKIVENFDSSVQAIDDYYRADGIDFNPAITKLENITIGNSNNSLTIAGNEFDEITKRDFYQGLIKQRGSRNSIDKIERKFAEDKLDVNVHEQYMLSRSYFGNTDRLNSVEFTLQNNKLETSPQVIKFASFADAETVYDDVLVYNSGDKRFVNPGNTAFATSSITSGNVKNLTAGSVLEIEAKYKVNTTTEISNVFDTIADYSTISTWNKAVSYKLTNLTRYQGQLFECIVPNTTISTVSTDIKQTGNVRPEFSYGTIATIDGVDILFQSSVDVRSDIVATGTVVNPTIASGTTLGIDGATISFINMQEVAVVTGPAEIIGTIANPVISDVAGKAITINGISIDFSNAAPGDSTEEFNGINNAVTPANIVETMNSVAGQSVYTVAQTISAAGYTIATVEVDGANAYTKGGFYGAFISGQDLDFTELGWAAFSEPSVEIIITLSSVAAADDLEDTFTVVEDITSTARVIKHVKVDNVLNLVGTDYSIAGQDVVFTTAPLSGAEITITITNTPVAITSAEIATTINNTLTAASISITAGVDNAILADLDPVFNRLRIRYWAPDTTSLLIVTPSATNALIGLKATGYNVITPSTIVTQGIALSLAQIVNQINSASPSHIIAAAASSKLRITSTGRSLLELSGSLLTSFGLPTSKAAVTNPVQAPTLASDAIIAINAANIAGVTVALNSSNQIEITSVNDTLALTSTIFNQQAGFVTGTVSSLIDSTLDNTFVNSEWLNISHLDPALFNVWVANDSDYAGPAINALKTKFNGWNVFQVQNTELYTEDLANNPSGVNYATCGICAGTHSVDGNDAQVTTQLAHNLAVGDFVMMLNTTTVPNIDGIHKVTKLGSNKEFYIDQYIDTCGSCPSIMTLRTHRFETIANRDAAMLLVQWNTPPGAFIWTDKDTTDVDSVNVFNVAYATTGADAITGAGYTTNATSKILTPVLALVRQQYTRILNTDIDNITVYDYDTNTPVLDLELFDPMRGIIPGVADIEIDVKSVHDVAVYNTSTEEEYEVDVDSAWTDSEVGKRWWDTSKVRYYDYDQGDLKDKSSNWGRQFVDSEVVIWEWTKSSVAPDDYASAVKAQTAMFGVIASGTAYYEFDAIKNQNEYYFTLQSEWNPTVTKYENVYYFWVRNKSTIGSSSKSITTSEVENIITDPSANGIYWFSVVDNDSIIISDIWDFVKKPVVVQLNRAVENNHSQWVLLSKDVDVIPDYWVTGLSNNLAVIDENEDRIPDFNLHAYARYGGDRTKRQAWFDDIPSARLNALNIINRLLVSVNVYDDYNSRFEIALHNAATAPGFEDKLPRNSWSWTDYITADYNTADTYITEVSSIEELNSLDITEYETARIEILNSGKIDRTEFYIHTLDRGWVLAKKNNAAIKWNIERLGKSYTWDMEPWDSVTWDNQFIAAWWKSIVVILRTLLFADRHAIKFNEFFFGMIDYTLTRNKQVDWAMKTSYIRLEVQSSVTQQKKYKKDSVQQIENYVNEIKPFHVKISEVNRSVTAADTVTLGVTETLVINEIDIATLVSTDITPTTWN